MCYFSDNLKVLMKSKGLTQEELIEALGIDKIESEMLFVEQSCERVSLKTVKKIADYFSITMERLVYEHIIPPQIKTYEEALKLVKDFSVTTNKDLRRIASCDKGSFALLGFFISKVYGVTGEQILKDFRIKKDDGRSYSLISPFHKQLLLDELNE